MFIVGTPYMGASLTPTLEFPIINSEFFNKVKKYSNLKDFIIVNLLFFFKILL